jgi:hypothetical protein
MTTISCSLNTTNPASKLGFEAWLDENKFVDIDHVQDKQQISVEVSDDVAEHELRFVLKNKTFEHTKIDDNNNIISDARLTVTDLSFDEIKLGHVLTELTVYTHDFNGSGTTTHEKFYGEMGCNGTVSLKFSAPIYHWLLEHI